MTAREWAVAALLGIAGLTALLSLAGLALMSGPHDRVHYLTPVSIIGSAAVAAAVVIQDAVNSRGIKALIVFAVLGVLNPILVHATSRAARVHEFGDWRLAAEKSPRS